MPTPPRSVAELLALLTAEPGRPRLTWYSGDGERVELSGAVLDNWVSKTANLLVEEFDAAPGTRVLLDLPGHWRAVVWALAVWRVGACVVTAARGEAGGDGEGRDGAAGLVHDGDGHVDLVVTSRPAAHPHARDLVAVTLPALARRFDGTLPAGAVDAAAAVMTYSDRIGWVPAVDPAAPALVVAGRPTTHAQLFEAAGSAESQPQRVLRPAADLAATLTDTLAVLTAGGSLVLADAAMAASLRADEARRAALVAGERVGSDRL